MMPALSINNVKYLCQHNAEASDAGGPGMCSVLADRAQSVAQSPPSGRACFIEDRKESLSCWEASFPVDLEEQTNAPSPGRSPAF